MNLALHPVDQIALALIGSGLLGLLAFVWLVGRINAR